MPAASNEHFLILPLNGRTYSLEQPSLLSFTRSNTSSKDIECFRTGFRMVSLSVQLDDADFNSISFYCGARGAQS